MALINIDDNDPWLVEYDACERLFRDVMELLTQRDRMSKNTQLYASVSADMRVKTKQYSNQILELIRKIDEALKQGIITRDEAERRTRQVERLQSNAIQLKHRQDMQSSTGTTAFAEAGTTNWGIEDDNGDDDDDDAPLLADVPVKDLKAQNRVTLQDQEQGLDELYKVITRQKAIAQTIHTEVDYQNEIIDDLADHADQTAEHLLDGTRRVRTISRKGRTCYYWIIIFLLFITIIAVAVS